MAKTPATDTTKPHSTTAADPCLEVELASLDLANPMMTASGTCGYAFEYNDFVDLAKLGAFVTKSITAEVRKGNEPTRIVETRAGMLNAIGLANVGLEAFLKDKLPLLKKMRETGPRIIVNVAGHSIEDYIATAQQIASEKIVDGIELNVSCPNVADGLTFGTNPQLLEDLVRQVREVMPSRCKLIVKLSPNVGDITATAAAAVDGGAQILSMINTYTAMSIDIDKRRPRLTNGTGGLSGPAIRPLAVYLVHRVYREVAQPSGVPIIGMGGIQYWQDAVEFLLAGATGLAVGTALFVDPATPVTLMEGLREYLSRQGCRSVREIIGALELTSKPAVTPYP